MRCYYINTFIGGVNMLSLKIGQLLEQQDRSAYWLSKQTGISPNNIGKICNGETSTIRFDTIEKICLALNCSINDLFESNDQKMQDLISGHRKSDTE